VSLAERVTLYSPRGAANKVFHAQIVKRGDGFVVETASGPLGGELRSSTKTRKPVPRDRAQEIYSNLVLDKLASGYSTQRPVPGETAAKPEPRKAPTWQHPELGRFQYDGGGWVRTISVPAFKGFKARGQRGGKCDLEFEADDETDLPTPAMIAVAAAVLDGQDELARKVIDGLWDDFNGRGPDSGMYWHGDLDAVAEGLDWGDEDAEPPGSANDLPKLMSLNGITVRTEAYGYDKPVAELSFSAAFEEEHGVGILTDGRTIIGIGYSSDVEPFKRPRTKRRRGGTGR
jgi:hypothetical protein